LPVRPRHPGADLPVHAVRRRSVPAAPAVTGPRRLIQHENG
jgi:hypothetical protein